MVKRGRWGGGRWALNGSGFDLEVRGAAAALVGESCASCSALCSAQPAPLCASAALHHTCAVGRALYDVVIRCRELRALYMANVANVSEEPNHQH